MLYGQAEDEVYNRLRIEASFHGIDLDASMKRAPKSRQTTEVAEGLPKFGDPSEYDGMSAKEKEELTQNMMKKLKGWAKGSKVLGN